MRAERALVIFTKWPRGGRAKRRLAAQIGRRAAGALAQSFLRDTIELAHASAADRVLVCFAPPGARERFAACIDGADLVAQSRGRFGTRLRAALDRGLVAGRRAVVIGADSPTLPPSLLRAAFARLDRADVVLGPAADGGYYLIGARAPLPPELFAHMPWSTASVASETISRARAAGLAVHLLPGWYDVDDHTGVERLLADRSGLRRAVTTRRTLASTGLLH